jgi:catechol 2,3-dioxygenase-like lactoylglutathione lyase family enzyme
MMLIDNLDHLVLTVGDITESCRFYSHVLGLEIITFGDERKALLVGEQKINLHQAGQELSPCAKKPTPGSADLCFISPQTIDEIYAHLAACDVPVELGPVPRTGVLGAMISLYFRDPDGNLIEISHYD